MPRPQGGHIFVYRRSKASIIIIIIIHHHHHPSSSHICSLSQDAGFRQRQIIYTYILSKASCHRGFGGKAQREPQIGINYTSRLYAVMYYRIFIGCCTISSNRARVVHCRRRVSEGSMAAHHPTTYVKQTPLGGFSPPPKIF